MRIGRLLVMIRALCALLAAAVCGAAHFAYVSNNDANTVSVVDLPSNAVVATVPVGEGARCAAA
jgi:YVTN family beta-propeller protein